MKRNCLITCSTAYLLVSPCSLLSFLSRHNHHINIIIQSSSFHRFMYFFRLKMAQKVLSVATTSHYTKSRKLLPIPNKSGNKTIRKSGSNRPMCTALKLQEKGNQIFCNKYIHFCTFFTMLHRPYLNSHRVQKLARKTRSIDQ